MPIYSPGNISVDILLQKLAGFNRKVTTLPNAAANTNNTLTCNGISYKSDGTRWLSVQEYTASIPVTTLTASTNLFFMWGRSNDFYVSRIDLNIAQVNAGSGTNFWNWATGTGLTISSGTVDTKSQAAGTGVNYAYTGFTGNPVTLAGSNTTGRLAMVFTLNGAPGNATLWANLTYRKVG